MPADLRHPGAVHRPQPVAPTAVDGGAGQPVLLGDREGDIPYALLHEMAAGGATWHVVRFDASEGQKLAGMAVEAIKRDIRDAMRRANQSADAAGLRLDPSAENPTQVKRRYAERARPIIRRLTRLLADVQKAAARFGIDHTAVSLADATPL